MNRSAAGVPPRRYCSAQAARPPGRSRAATAAVRSWAATRIPLRAWEQRARRMVAVADCVLGRQAGLDVGSSEDCDRPTKNRVSRALHVRQTGGRAGATREIVADALA